MAALSKRYQRDHASSYPAGIEHMPADTSLIERARDWEHAG